MTRPAPKRAPRAGERKRCRLCGEDYVMMSTPDGELEQITPAPHWDGNVRVAPSLERCVILAREPANDLLRRGWRLHLHHRVICRTRQRLQRFEKSGAPGASGAPGTTAAR